MCPESHPKRAEIPECPDWLSQTCLCCDFTAEISLVLGKIQILFIAHYFLPFYYSVICSEKLEKSVLDRVQMKFCSYQCMVH